MATLTITILAILLNGVRTGPPTLRKNGSFREITIHATQWIG